MTGKLHFNLLIPGQQLVSDDVDQVDMPTVEGWRGILPGHAPFMTILSAGMLTIRTGSSERRIFVRAGFAEQAPAGLTVLAEEATPAEDLDRKTIDRQIRDAQEDVADADTDAKRLAALHHLESLKEVAEAL